MNIKFATNEADRIRASIRNAKLKGDGAIGKISRARNVDSDISSRLNISGDFQYLANNVSIEIGRLESLMKALRSAETDFEEADSMIRSRSKKVTASFRKANLEAYLDSIYTGIVERIDVFSKKQTGFLTLLGLSSIFTFAGPIVGATSIVLLGTLLQVSNDTHKSAASFGNAEQKQTSSGDGKNESDSETKATDTPSIDEAMQQEINKLLQSEEFLGGDWSEGEPRQITKEVYKDFISQVGKIMGISMYGNFSYDSPKGYAGWFAPEYPTSIFVSKLLVGSYSDYGSFEQNLRVIVHEMRHAYQFAAIQNSEKYLIDQATLDQWTNEMANYVNVGESFQGYVDQSIEVDARNFTREAFQEG